MKKNRQHILYKTTMPRALYGWLILPVSIVLGFSWLGMHPLGALFYACISVVIYLASNPDFCRLSLYEDAVKITYYRPFNREYVFSFEEFQTVNFQRGELFHALPFLFKPVHLNDYLEFIVNEKKSRKFSVNVKCNRTEIEAFTKAVNAQKQVFSPQMAC